MYGINQYSTFVKKWGVFEVSINGPEDGNPFKDQTVQGIFTGRKESVVTEGFYDGDGIYKIRFMPSFTGNYGFVIKASFLDTPVSGSFHVDEADPTVHGPVHTSNTYHFAYADGTPFIPVGTTCYVFDLKGKENIDTTLETLKNSAFNKIRFCVFPKHYIYNFNDPVSFPYAGTPMDHSVLTEKNFFSYTYKTEGNHFSHERFNPEHFRTIEYCIEELANAGIEADIILFHPYDRWGFSVMKEEENDFYLEYVINRFAAYRNVWWAMANEWDLFPTKTVKDWEHLAETLVNKDPYNHLRSIHNCREIYDHTRAWITHVSMQRVDLYKGAELTNEYRTRYQKPVVMDEIGYEGEMPLGWGNLTPEEMTRRFWETAIRGGYPQHGETYLSDPDGIWWAHGGKLQGESWKRAAFLKKILEEVPGNGLMPLMDEWDSVSAVPESEWFNPVKSQYIYYYSFMRPSFRDFHMDPNTDFAVDVIDTYDMTITLYGIGHGDFRVELPKKQYMAIRLRIATEADYAMLNNAMAEVPAEEVAVEEAPVSLEETVELEEPILFEETVELDFADPSLEETEILETIDEIPVEELPIEEPVEGMPEDFPEAEEVVEEESEPEGDTVVTTELDLQQLLARRLFESDDEDEVFEASPINSPYYDDVEQTGVLDFGEYTEPFEDNDTTIVMRPVGGHVRGLIDETAQYAVLDETATKDMKRLADTLRIPPIDFTRSINDDPKDN